MVCTKILISGYRSRLDSLEMFEELKPEESKNPVITWHQRLRSLYKP